MQTETISLEFLHLNFLQQVCDTTEVCQCPFLGCRRWRSHKSEWNESLFTHNVGDFLSAAGESATYTFSRLKVYT